MTWEKIHYQKFDCFRPCRQECTGLRPSGVCKKVYQLNLRRRRENTRKYANPRLANATLPPDGGKKMLIVLCLSVRREALPNPDAPNKQLGLN